MKKTIWIYIFMGIFVFSCSDSLLKEDPKSKVSFEYYDSKKGIETGIVAAYDGLRIPFSSKNDISGFYPPEATEQRVDLELLGTDTYMHARDTGSEEAIDRYETQMNSSLPELYVKYWAPTYKAIKNCNIIIGQLKQGIEDLSEDLQRTRMGELRFLRAYYYFDLVQEFGDIPLTTSPKVEAKTDFTRASVAKVYKLIISDLSLAVDNLPVSQDDYGRATKGAAQHLLSKVYLTRGSAIDSERGQQSTDMDSSAFYADQVINSGNYQLVPDYADLWDINNQRNSEVIFSAQFSKDQINNNNSGNSVHLYFGMTYDLKPGMKRDTKNGRPWNRIRPTNFTIRKLFEPTIDSRFHKTFQSVWYSNNPNNIPEWEAEGGFEPKPELLGEPKFSVGDTAIWVTSEVYPDDTNFDSLYASRSYYYMPMNRQGLANFFVNIKHMDPTRPGINDVDGQRDGFLFRLGETYLIAAEAYGRMGNFAKAAERLNVVRKRAAYKEGELKDVAYWKVYGADYDDRFKSTEAEMRITPSDLANQPSFIDFMLDERARELSGELYRWKDLVRTEKLVERARKYNPYAAPHIKKYHKFRPIPQNYIDRLDPKPPIEEVQNEGYY